MSDTITIEKTILLKDFPSGSSLEYFENKLYLVGDDAKNLLILDTAYHEIDSIEIFKGLDKRIAKVEKADFEASTIVGLGKTAKMIIFGSGSTALRKKVAHLNINNPADTLLMLDTSPFIDRLQPVLRVVNIEGAAMVKDMLVLANRANAGNPVNSFVITTTACVHNPDIATFTLTTIDLPKQKNVAGISGLTYLDSHDVLLFTASTEATDNAYADGTIGDSYIGWIKNISNRIKSATIKPDGFINLSTSKPEFKEEKIESLCVESFEDNKVLLHLVADNDNGESRLFKIRLQFHE
jgi:hypothetical protein